MWSLPGEYISVVLGTGMNRVLQAVHIVLRGQYCGRAGFYKGRIAAAIVDVLKKDGGVMTADDLAHHRTVTTRPIHTTYRGYTIYEVPPPTQARPLVAGSTGMHLFPKVNIRRFRAVEFGGWDIQKCISRGT